MRIYTISGTVEFDAHAGLPIAVGVFDLESEETPLIDYFVMDEPGPFVFTVGEGAYGLAAFADQNRDFVYQPGEPYGEVDDEILVEQKLRGDVAGLTIVLGREGVTVPGYDYDLRASMASGRLPLLALHVGDPAELEDDRFSFEHAEEGLWNPKKMAMEAGAGIFFLEPFDPGKIPVLFVHGVLGSPREFGPLIEKMNRQKFQPWVALYPSGLRFDALSGYLSGAMTELEQKYKFKRYVLVAHSAGGLLTRSFINKHVVPGETAIPVRFISISSPWGGQEWAGRAADTAPEVVPSWMDLKPGSPFLQALGSRPLPPATEHHLLFGFIGRSTFVGGNNDGVVAIESMIPLWAQRDAAEVYGFPEDHTTILTSPEVAQTVNRILAGIRPREK